jgi:hypothetical protein
VKRQRLQQGSCQHLPVSILHNAEYTHTARQKKCPSDEEYTGFRLQKAR